MYLHLLDDDELTSFVRAARFIMGIDGVVDVSEAQLLEAISIETGLAEMPDPYADLESTVDGLRSLSSPVLKRAAFLELAGVVYADEHSTDGEKECLQAIAAGLEISEEFQCRADDQARRAVELRREADELVAGGGA